jgi:cytochrome c-type biogenesis protein CcmH/NrfG
LLIANIYKEQDLRQEALQEYKKVIEIDPEDVEARNNLGVIYAIEGKLKAAISTWEKVLELETDNREARDNILIKS